MHAISYQLKRAHLCAVRIGRGIFNGLSRLDPGGGGVLDMTPARFDILSLVNGEGRSGQPAPRWTFMALLHKTLGLARATISKAIKRLRDLGLVSVEFVDGGRRDKIVRMTQEGVARFEEARRLVFDGDKLARHYEELVRRKVSPTTVRDEGVSALAKLFQRIEAVARHHFDTSEPLYLSRILPCGKGGGPDSDAMSAARRGDVDRVLCVTRDGRGDIGAGPE